MGVNPRAGQRGQILGMNQGGGFNNGGNKEGKLDIDDDEGCRVGEENGCQDVQGDGCDQAEEGSVLGAGEHDGREGWGEGYDRDEPGELLR